MHYKENEPIENIRDTFNFVNKMSSIFYFSLLIWLFVLNFSHYEIMDALWKADLCMSLIKKNWAMLYSYTYLYEVYRKVKEDSLKKDILAGCQLNVVPMI